MKKNSIIVLVVLLIVGSMHAQSGGATGQGLTNALNAGANDVKGVYKGLVNILNIIAGLVAIFGIFRVYSKYQNGDQDTNKAIAQFGGAFIFLIAAGFVVKTFFGLS